MCWLWNESMIVDLMHVIPLCGRSEVSHVMQTVCVVRSIPETEPNKSKCSKWPHFAALFRYYNFLEGIRFFLWGGLFSTQLSDTFHKATNSKICELCIIHEYMNVFFLCTWLFRCFQKYLTSSKDINWGLFSIAIWLVSCGLMGLLCCITGAMTGRPLIFQFELWEVIWASPLSAQHCRLYYVGIGKICVFQLTQSHPFYLFLSFLRPSYFYIPLTDLEFIAIL